mmetsp:Transcript_11568/g.15925  ORF Transcript_11568/g.15925 Transcript_11568/m.15925 type:complete len:210 (+) Transcript_11568:1581-2210(+)
MRIHLSICLAFLPIHGANPFSFSSSSSSGLSASFTISGSSYPNGNYHAKISSIYNSPAANKSESLVISAFDEQSSTFVTCCCGYYTHLGTTYTGPTSTAVNGMGDNVKGEWIQITFPFSVPVYSFTLTTPISYITRFPCKGYLLGSMLTNTFFLSTVSSSYSTFRFVPTALTGDSLHLPIILTAHREAQHLSGTHLFFPPWESSCSLPV